MDGVDCRTGLLGKMDVGIRDVNVHKNNSFFKPSFQFVSISKRNVVIYSC
jgi:hypothetical protein